MGFRKQRTKAGMWATRVLVITLSVMLIVTMMPFNGIGRVYAQPAANADAGQVTDDEKAVAGSGEQDPAAEEKTPEVTQQPEEGQQPDGSRQTGLDDQEKPEQTEQGNQAEEPDPQAGSGTQESVIIPEENDSTARSASGAKAGSVSYWERTWNGTTVVGTQKTREDVTEVPADGAMTSGWYYLDSNVTVSKRISLTGDTYLILGDGCKLDVKGLYIPKGATLRVYGQSEETSEGSGCLYSHPSEGAAIGAYSGHNGGNIEIHGGNIKAEGGSHCAGIGGNDDNRKDIGSFTLYEGSVTATGGESGAGIGGGRACEGGVIDIYGGTVTAQGGHYGAGIGGGNGQDTNPLRGAHGGIISIYGGEVTSTGGADAAGIGGGEGGNAGRITISGGTVTAQGGDYSAGIGCGEGESTGTGGEIAINGGTITATGGKNGAGIGGGEDGYCEEITIDGGNEDFTNNDTKVTATGGRNGAGIGAGRDADGGTITINGGAVIATGTDSSAGIGGGDASDNYADYSNIEISGGTITAIGHSKGAGIGGGEYGHATVTITGGKISATGGESGGAGLGNGKDGSGSAITLGYTDTTEKDISIGASSYKGLVRLNRPFQNNQNIFHATNAVTNTELGKLAESPLKAWTDAGTAGGDREEDSWTGVQQAIYDAGAGMTITLTESISADGEPCITIPAGRDITIDLNGKTMDRQLTEKTNQGSVILVESGAALTIIDSSENKSGKIKGGADEKGGGICNKGTLHVKAGTISGNTADCGGGIYSEGTVTISGGTITGNTSAKWGGGVYLADGTNATLHLNGGTVGNNTCTSNGGGVHVSGTAFMTAFGAPTIQNNRKGTGTAASANNVNLADGAIISIDSDDKTLASEAKIGVSMSNPAGNITSGLKGKGTAENFTSDNEAYSIAIDGAGEAYLSKTADRTADSWTKLQEQINAAASGELIELSKDIVNTENKTRIKVDGSKKIIIDLAGHELDRNRHSVDGDGHVIQVFGGSALTVRDSVGGGKITGGYAKRGGGIYINEDATCLITGGAVTGNTADVDGGGIYVRGILRMTGGTVSYNYADDTGGGIYVTSDGRIDLLSAGITQNTADEDGGGLKLHLKAHSTIKNCRITYNKSADDTGGGFHMDASGKKLTITDTKIDHNTSDDDGGGIYLQNGIIVMNGGSVSSNYSENDGGGVKTTKGTTFTATGTLINGNTAKTEEGGGVKTYGTTTLKSCTINNNKSKRQGGGVFNDNDDGSKGRLTLEGCTITGNSAANNGGGVYSDKKLTLIGGSITGNTASGNGGGVFIGDDSEDTGIGGELIVRDNKATGKGADIFLRTHNLAVQSKLTDKAKIGITKENDDGLGVFTSGYSAANQNEPPSTYFFSPEGLDVVRGAEGEASIASDWKTLRANIKNADNEATIELSQDYTASSGDDYLEIPEDKIITIDLNGHTLNRNRTSKDGDGHVIWVKEGATLYLIDTTATEATETTKAAPGKGTITGGYSYDGGGIYVDKDAACHVEGVNIKNNTADDDGGGLFVKGDLRMSNCVVSYNETDDCGGAIYSKDTAKVELNKVLLTRNTANNDDGGCLHLYLGEDSSFEDCEITYNIAGDCGGGLFLDAKNRKLTINNTTISNNSSVDDDGGGIYLMNGTIEMTGGSISGNSTEHDSGGIKVTKGTTFTATGVEFKDNDAKGEEGGALKNYGETTLTNCTVSGNSAKKEGGGIFNDNDGGSAGEMTIDGCTITGNTSDDNGGGVYSDHKLTIKGNTTIGSPDAENTSGGDDSQTSDSSAAANKAEGKGSGIFIGKDSKFTNIQDKLIIQNNDGEDVYLRDKQVLTITGQITGTQVGVINMDSTGVFTKDYSTYHPYEDAGGAVISGNHPSKFFSTSVGAIPADWYEETEKTGETEVKTKTEAMLVSSWPDLQTLINNAAAGKDSNGNEGNTDHIVVLDRDYTAGSEDVSLEIGADPISNFNFGNNGNNGDDNNNNDENIETVNVTIDLNGHTLNRNLRSKKMVPLFQGSEIFNIDRDAGHAFQVNPGATLTIIDSKGEAAGDDSASGSEETIGVIMGGYAEKGGGIVVSKGATLKVEGGAILGNHATDHGGGIYNAGTLEMTGTDSGSDGTPTKTNITVYGNGANDNGGGIYSTGSSSTILHGVAIENNTAGDHGGGLNLCTGDAADATEATNVIKNCAITGNKATKYGGGLRLDAKGKTLKITDTTIDNNNSIDDGAGIYLHNGTINMSGGSVSDNSSYNDGGGAKITDKTTFIADKVKINNNRAITEEGGGVKNAGTATLKGCELIGNSAKKQGGGAYNDETLTLEDCTIQENSTEDVGGGVYSDDKLTIKGSTVIGGTKTADGKTAKAPNIATNKGGGVYVGGSSKDTAVQGSPVIEGNEAANFGDDLYLRDGKKLALTGALTKRAEGEGNDGAGGNDGEESTPAVPGAQIHVDLESGTGVLTKDYKKYNQTETGEAKDPKQFFTFAVGYDVSVNTDGEVELSSGWNALKKKIESAKSGTVISLDKDYAAKASDDRIEIDDDKSITVDLAGHTLNRNRIDKDEDGHVFEVYGGSELTIRDSASEAGDPGDGEDSGDGEDPAAEESTAGAITGGWAENGGGINVHKNGVLNLEAGTVTGNRATENGGGICVRGTLNMTGGAVKDNTAENNGGGIYLDDSSTLNLEGGEVTGNAADKIGGGIKVDNGAKANVKGSPVVSDNTGAKAGNDVYLPTGCALVVKGKFTGEAKLGVTLGNTWGPVTSGYARSNGNSDPAQYFRSTEGYAVYLKDGEAVLRLKTYGETEHAAPFISANNQVNDDIDTVSSKNWMSGISGERLLSEINTPGSHDSGMNNVDKNLNTTVQWITTVGSVVLEASGALIFVIGLLAAPFTGGLSLLVGVEALLLTTSVVAVVNLAIPTDWTSKLSWVADAISADKAKTQKEYINQQLEEGARQLDIRVNNRKKVYKFMKDGTFNGWKWSDNGKDLYICHGKKGGGTYLANDDNNDYLSLNQVLEWVEDYLEKHPTETIMLDLRPETEKTDEHPTIYKRARKILETSALKINPSTGEPFLYKEPGSDDYFAPYTHMPKLADCRGKITIMPENNEFLAQVGGFRRKGLTSENLDELDFQNTKEMMAKQIREEYGKANGDGKVKLPTDADTHYDRMWYWEMNCTGQKAGMEEYIMDIEAPHVLAEYVNAETIGKGKTFSPDLAGKYIGWVRLDSYRADYAETIWRTNYHKDLEYCTVTVKSELNDTEKYPVQTYKVLKGTKITIPGNIYDTGDDRYFDCWKADDGSTWTKGDTFKADADVTFTARWLEEGKTPVSIVWNDGGDADKLRPESIDLTVKAGGQTRSLTLKGEDGWNGVISAAKDDTATITPEWSKIDKTIMFDNRIGKDADGNYCCEVTREAGSGYTLTFTHTPQAKAGLAGKITWIDSDNAAEKRPASVTVRLLRDGAEVASGTRTVTAADDWQYDFGEYAKYKNGKAVNYTVTVDPIADYETDIDGFTITNTYAPAEQKTISVTGSIEWDDDSNAKNLRPGGVDITVLANGEEVVSENFPETRGSIWLWNFNDLPKTDAEGNLIEYTIQAETLDGYTVECKRVTDDDPDNASGADGETEEDMSYMYAIKYTLATTEEEKTPAAVSTAPDPIETAYTGKEQALVKEGEASGGTMMYALGDSAETAPEASAFSTELPVGINAGTYHVWYYAKGNVTHTDSELKCVEAVIAKAEQTIETKDVSGTVGDTDKAVEAAAIGANGTTEGVGALSYVVTEDSDPDADVVTVDPDTGKLELKEKGWAKVEITAAETDNYNDASETVKVTVTDLDDKCTLTFYEDTKGTEVWKEITLDKGTALQPYAGYGTEEPYILEKEGYTFAGWATYKNIIVDSYKKKDGTLNPLLEGKLFDFNTEINESIYAYPIWIRDRLNVVIQPVEPGTGDTEDVNIDDAQALNFTVDMGEKIGMYNLVKATREGYELEGWYTNGGALWNGEDWKTLEYAETVTDETEGWEVTPEHCDRNKNGDPIVQTNLDRRFSYYTVTLTARWAKDTSTDPTDEPTPTDPSNPTDPTNPADPTEPNGSNSGNSGDNNGGNNRGTANSTVTAITQKIRTLPSADKITTKDKKAIEEIRGLYDSLTDEQKKLVDPELVKKFTQAEAALKKAEQTAAREKQMGADGTALGKGASFEAANKAILAMKNDSDPKGSVFSKLKLRSKKQKKNSITLNWTKVKGAKKYVIYGNKCGKKNKMKKLATVKSNKFVLKKVLNNKGKKVKVMKGKYYKAIIVALDKNNNVVSTSKVIHVATKGGKVGNHKKVTVKKSVLNKAKKLKKGKSLKLKAKAVKQSKKLAVKKHVGIRYESTNKKIATVSKKGVVKAKKKGTCYIFAYAQNGVFKKIKVTVR